MEEVQVTGNRSAYCRERGHGERAVLRAQQTVQQTPGPPLARDLQRKSEQAHERSQDHRDLRPGLLTMLPGEMVDRPLDDTGIPQSQLRNEFGRDSRCLTLQDDPLQI